MTPDDKPNIVLVHGAWADGSCWSAVIERLQAQGHTVTAPQFPMGALADDVARLRQVLAPPGRSDGGCRPLLRRPDHDRPRHRRPERDGSGYVAAFGLDEGESIGALLAQGPPTPAIAHLDIDEQGYAWLPEDDFVAHFAGDVDPVKAKVMHAVQQPLAGECAGGDDGRSGMEVTPLVVPGRSRTTRQSAGRRATVRGTHGSDHGRSPVE